jgi:hypothetical protein
VKDGVVRQVRRDAVSTAAQGGLASGSTCASALTKQDSAGVAVTARWRRQQQEGRIRSGVERTLLEAMLLSV